MRKTSIAENALREKSSSNLNASPKRYSPGQAKPQASNVASTKPAGRRASGKSVPTFHQDTVQYKHSPAKEEIPHGTPEWKKRVLKENVGGDLFSPKQLGLESVFKPPTIKPKAKKTGFTSNDIPSSPPTYPVPSHARSTDPGREPKKPVAATKSRFPSSEKAATLPGSRPEKIEHSEIVQEQTENPNSSTPLGDSKSHDAKSSGLPTPSSPNLASTHGNFQLAPDGSDRSVLFSDGTRNENISPFYVSRHNTVDGRVEYAAIDMSMQRLRSQMDKMRLQQQNLPSSRSSDQGINYADSKPDSASMLQEKLDEVTSHSLPDDLSTGTDAWAANGGFVSIHRGGYSNDGSFQRKPISPSLLPDLDGPSLRLPSSNVTQRNTSRCLPHDFSQTKSRTPSSPPPSLPRTPRHQKHESTDSNDRPRSSGSPLKLFDKYDTFTNDRLVRRMSKFEETLHNDLLEGSTASTAHEPPSSPSPRRRRPQVQHRTPSGDKAPSGRRVSSFGYGELNDHQFPPYQELHSGHSLDEDQMHSNPDEPRLQENNAFRFVRTTSPQAENETSRKSKVSGIRDQKPRGASQYSQDSASGIDRLHGMSLGGIESNSPISQQEAVQTSTGKRLPYSPAKNPVAKRRRTLRNPEEIDQVHLSLQEHLAARQPPASSGRKRKDALYESDRQAADPSILAMRQIRQPKVPTPSQTYVMRGDGQEARAIESSNQPLREGSTQLQMDQYPAMDPPTQIVAGALATVALNTAKEVTSGSRKASVTTADFFNEAQQIMQLIRAKGRPRSSHTTNEGSEVGYGTIVEESVVYESTKDEFSRPPSREGSPRGLKLPPMPNARAASHLRKFEDDQDLGLALSSSLKTLRITNSRRASRASASRRGEADRSNSGEESDPPNIRIRECIVQPPKRKYASSTRDFSDIGPQPQPQSQDSDLTSGPSSGRSNPTGSSHSSTNRMVIAPETVAHLLSDQMAGMVFDRQKQLWVKRKSSPNVGGLENLDHTQSEGTEEDFFGDIPDLTVNEMEELQRVKEAVSSVKSKVSAMDKVSVRDQAMFKQTQGEGRSVLEVHDDTRPRTAEGNSIVAIDNSSAPSKFSHFASSGPQPGTRATSWGDDALSKEPQLSLHPAVAAPERLGNKEEEQVEHEISIFEGRESQTPRCQSNRKHQARVVTVAFSSPLVDQRYLESDQAEDPDTDEGELSLDDSPVRYSTRQDHPLQRPLSSESAGKSARRSMPRRMSINNRSFHARPMSRLDEENEMSLVHCSISNKHMSMELAISTPLPLSKSVLVPSTTGQRSSIGFHLSPLPDFTVHQVDRPIDDRHDQPGRRLTARETDNILSLCAQDLVKNLTDVEPYEPYWDYIRTVDLHGRGLASLHMLDEFCGRVEELDVSGNTLEGLNGVPRSVRQLNVRDNCLSDLAAWDFLHNLQYLDVSGNQIASLRGFQHLVHLRSLKADNNAIASLNGLEDLNGLVSLSLRGSRLTEVDFDNFDL